MATSSWNFCCYLEPNQRALPEEDRRDVVDRWTQLLGESFEADLDVRLKYLAAQPRPEWKLPYFRKLRGPYVELGEVRLFFDNVQRRLLGGSLGDGNWVWLIGCDEKGGDFVPKSAPKTALKRLAEVKKDRSIARACDRD